VDLVCEMGSQVTAEQVNAAFTAAANGKMRGILEVTNDPIVSSDVKGDPASSIVDLQETVAIGGNLIKVLAWYDNEWGYSSRLADLVDVTAQRLR